MHFFLTLATLTSVAVAQYDYGGGGGSSSSGTTPAAATTTASGSSATHTVTVGAGGGLVFSPNSITADKGDTIQFVFSGGNHTVTEAAFSKPCNPLTKGFTSGFTGSNSESFSIVLTSSDPMYFYCAQPGHCQAGMVGAINPPSSGNTLAAFKSTASSAKTDSSPSGAYGGVISSQGGAVSTASGAATVTGGAPTTTGGGKSTSSPSPTGNSAASLAGDIFKAVVGVFGAAALLV
ncbi:hypothetical protein ABW20_dc0107403 [Dactylellina cionopaga]|nr:hypothetical protein ABW20_dc0107403 [Dactylellina cionopaga]